MMVVAKDEDLSRVRKWADDNKLLINTRKTQLLLMSRKRRGNLVQRRWKWMVRRLKGIGQSSV